MPPLASGEFELSKLRHRVEVSTDGRTWSSAVVERPAQDVLADGTRVVLRDGSYRLRVIVEIGTVREATPDVAFQATGDAGGWRIAGLRITQPPRLVPTPGREPDRFDFSNIAVASEIYRDGRTRTRRLPMPPVIMFQFRTGEWEMMAAGLSVVSLPDSGHVRIETSDGRVRSNVYAVTLPRALDAYRSAIAKPTRSRHVGGAMVVSGRVSRQYSDMWRPVVDRRPYRIQSRSGKKWVTVFRGRVKSGGKGEIQATVPLPGKGVYRLVIGSTSIATWQLAPTSATKTAKVAKPAVRKLDKGSYAVRVAISQRFSDGRWGSGWSGWKYQIQYRKVGSTTWRSTSRATIQQSEPFDKTVQATGRVEFRIKATYKGRTYSSPIGRA